MLSSLRLPTKRPTKKPKMPTMMVPPKPPRTMRELRSFMADLPAEHVGICHDIGHTRLIGLDIADAVANPMSRSKSFNLCALIR